ncbi:MAG: hypothetical protein AAB838_00035 [Patescibacteria group bacterium]
MQNLKDQFYKVYNNLPLPVREEVILVVKDEPITWKIARLEIDNDTKLSKELLEKLNDLKFI